VDKVVSEQKIDGTAGQDVFVGKDSNKWRYLVLIAALLIGIPVTYFLYDYLIRFVEADNFFERSKMRTATVTRGDYERSVSIEGNVVATFNPKLYAQDAGEVFLKVDEGDIVSKGELLAVVENPELVSQLKREQASLELQRVELDTLKNQIKLRELEAQQSFTLLEINLAAEQRELDRMTRIVNVGSISRNEYEKTKDRVHALDMQVKNRAEQDKLTSRNQILELKTKGLSINQQSLLVIDLQRQVDALQIRSPVDGVVGDIQVEEQDTVARKQPLLNVVDLSSYEIEVLIPETYAESLKKGLPVRVTYRNEEHNARLASISPQVRAGTVAARVVFLQEAPAALRQNLRLNTKIILESKLDVLKVRRGPFVESHGGRGIYVLQDDDLAHYQRIEVGSVGISEVEITSGLHEGDLVIISNTAELLGAETVLITD
jgi:HlyD family secretion protein